MSAVRAVLRRSSRELVKDLLLYGGVEMDLTTHRVTRDGRSIRLGPTEFRLLRVLLARPRRVYSREQLLDQDSLKACRGTALVVTFTAP